VQRYLVEEMCNKAMEPHNENLIVMLKEIVLLR
jgi:hypothetical protein